MEILVYKFEHPIFNNKEKKMFPPPPPLWDAFGKIFFLISLIIEMSIFMFDGPIFNNKEQE